MAVGIRTSNYEYFAFRDQRIGHRCAKIHRPLRPQWREQFWRRNGTGVMRIDLVGDRQISLSEYSRLREDEDTQQKSSCNARFHFERPLGLTLGKGKKGGNSVIPACFGVNNSTADTTRLRAISVRVLTKRLSDFSASVSGAATR